MKKRIMAVLLTTALLLNVSAAFAAGTSVSVPEPLPEVGVLMNEDFEGYSGDPTVVMRTKNGGIWNIIAGAPKLVNVGGSTAIQGGVLKEKGVSMTATYSLADHGYNDTNINTGKLLIEYDVYVPAGSQLTGTDMQITHLQTWADGGTADEQAYLSVIACKSDKPMVYFKETDVKTYGQETGVELEYDTWHKVSTVIDYDGKEVGHYVDGVWKAGYKGSVAVKTAYKFNWMRFIAESRVENPDSNPQICLDNVKVERLGAGMSASIANVGENYIDVKFSSTVKPNVDFDVNDFGFKKISDSDWSHPASVEYQSADTLRFTLGSLDAGANYMFRIDGAVTSALDANSSVPAGSIMLFNTTMQTEATVLLDQDFEDTAFPTGGTESNANNEFALWLSVNGKFDTVNSETGRNTNKQYGYKYVSGVDDPNGGKMLKFQCPDDSSYTVWQGNTAEVKFPLSETVSSGILTMEFDAGANNNVHQWANFTFGLSDKNDKKTDFNIDTTWTDSDIYAGLVHQNSNDKALTAGKRESSSAAYNYDSTLIDIVNDDTLHHYKIVIDLDAKNYTLYLDNSSQWSFDYLPGGKTSAEYDNFVFARTWDALTATHILTRDAFYLDNIKVTHQDPPPAMAEGITFKKYDGSTYNYNETLPAGTNIAEVNFSKEMGSVDVEVVGMAAADYTASVNGSKATVTFNNCLAAGQSYTLVIKQTSTDASGKPIVSDVSYPFTADEGEIVYSVPVLKTDGAPLAIPSEIKAGDMLSAEVTVINTTAVKKNANMVLAVYKDNRLVFARMQEYTPAADTAYRDMFTLTAEADGSCAGADSVKAFIFNNTTEIRPLAGAAVAE